MFVITTRLGLNFKKVLSYSSASITNISSVPSEADPEILKQVITISPHQYREEVEVEDEEELNEMRQKAGLEPVKVFPEQDAELKAFKSMAGL
mgnify:CR=1 FL=1